MIKLRCNLSSRGWGSWLSTLVVTTLLLVTTGIGRNPLHSQENDTSQPTDATRYKEVSDYLNQLKKLRTDLGPGHPRVQEIIRNLKLLEEDLRMEQTFSERLAAQLKVTEEELRERQKLDWEAMQSAQSTDGEQQGVSLPSLETIETLERQALTELQRIEWDLASEGTTDSNPENGNPFEADELRVKALQLTRDLAKLRLDAVRSRQVNPKSPGSSVQDKTATQMASLELAIAEANAKAAEIDLSLKRQAEVNLPAERLRKLNDRREVVQQQLKGLPSKKALAKKISQSQQSSEQLAIQIRDLETQRIQHQLKSSELNELLEVVRQTLATRSPAQLIPKSIN